MRPEAFPVQSAKARFPVAAGCLLVDHGRNRYRGQRPAGFVRLDHCCLNVRDMDASIRFYESRFGMKLFSRREIKESNAEIAFVGYDEQGMRLELTHWRDWGPDEYTEGSKFDHIAIVVADLDETMTRLRAAGVEVAKEPTQLSIGSRIAFVLDLDGNWVELIERKEA